MVGGAVLLAALAALTKGPLAAFRVLPPGSHRVLDVVVGVALALGPLAALHHPSLEAIGLLELSAVVLWRLAYAGIRPPRPSRPPRLPAGRVAGHDGHVGPGPGPGPAHVAPGPGPAPVDRAGMLGAGARGAGRVSATVSALVRATVGEAAPVADELLGRGARRLGTVLGRRSARRASR